MKELIDLNEIIDSKFGEAGTASREAFNHKAFSNYFAEVIKYRRKQLGLTQEDLAQSIGKKRPYISRIEKGEDIRLSNFALVANALNMSIEFKIAE
jgi:ribosome-binding protein aMBF1 (putative translation factor)